MAGDFMRVQAELSDLRLYKAQLREKLNQVQPVLAHLYTGF